MIETLERARADFFDSLPDHFERHRLGREALEQLQTDRLRALLRNAVDRSRFHRARLGDVDPESFTLRDLPDLPPMTKAEMMAAYDDVVTDDRLSLDVVNRHLAEAGEDPELLLDRYVVLGSGGSTGVRGVFACDVLGAAQHMAAVVRGGLAGLVAVTGWPPPGLVPMAIVAAPTCMHATRGLSSIFLRERIGDITYAPVTAPFDEVVAAVDAAQPLLLIGYPSVIARLADAQTDGRLSIDPMVVSVTSEQLTAGQVERITAGLGVVPTNSYGTTEGLMGTAPPGSHVFDFASDLAYVEFVDADDNAVDVGETADHVLVTNLFNHAQPLIRYRIDDTMTPAPPSPEHGHQRAVLEGRCDEHLMVGGVAVHPLTIRATLLANAQVADYQVRVSGSGDLDIDLVAHGAAVDVADVEQAVVGALTRAGSAPLRVTARLVDDLDRDPGTGKARRFVTA